jgi:anti-sigma B factor antagonist
MTMAHRERSHQGLLVSEQESDVAAVLSVAGAVDMVTAPQLEAHVSTVLSRQPTALVIDLSLVEFLGTAGIAVLVHVRNNAADMPFAVVADGPATSRPLQLLGIDKFFPIYPRVADAMHGLGLAVDEVG